MALDMFLLRRMSPGQSCEVNASQKRYFRQFLLVSDPQQKIHHSQCLKTSYFGKHDKHLTRSSVVESIFPKRHDRNSLHCSLISSFSNYIHNSALLLQVMLIIAQCSKKTHSPPSTQKAFIGIRCFSMQNPFDGLFLNRYLSYVSNLVWEPRTLPHKQPFRLKRVVIGPLPLFNKARFVFSIISHLHSAAALPCLNALVLANRDACVSIWLVAGRVNFWIRTLFI